MEFLKFKATQLFDGYALRPTNLVLITDQNGVVKDLIPEADAGDNIQYFSGLLCPGFVNAHCHLELSHLKGVISKHTGLVDFVSTVVTQRHFATHEIENAIEMAELDMIEGGIVAIGDICNNAATVVQKQKNNLTYYNFIETSGWLPQLAEDRFVRSKQVYEMFKQSMPNEGVIGTGNRQAIVPHAPYSVSTQLWQRIVPGFSNETITIHNQETAFEDELFKNGTGDFLRMYEKMNLDNRFFSPTGKTSLQSYLLQLQTAKQILLVHNTYTSEADVAFACKQQLAINWCICVNANLYIENALPPVALLRKYGAKIVLGTDSLASNDSLSILAEMKTIANHYPEIPMVEILQWATLNGATALQMEAQFGRFEKGKQPGVVLIDHVDMGKIQANSTVRRLV